MDPSASNPSAETFESEKNILNELVSKVPSQSLDLPNLKQAPKESGFLDWYQKFIEWLQGKASEGTEALGVYDVLRILGSFLEKNWVWVLALLIIFAIAYLLYKSSRALGKNQNSTQAKIFLNSGNQEIQDWIKKSLAEQNFSLAARLRWILFLKDQKSPHYLTPKEYTRRHSIQILDVPNMLSHMYRCMFDSKANSLSDFQSFEVQVQQLSASSQVLQ